jgi:hypothetical protein
MGEESPQPVDPKQQLARRNCLAFIHHKQISSRQLATLLGRQPHQARELLAMPTWHPILVESVAQALGLQAKDLADPRFESKHPLPKPPPSASKQSGKPQSHHLTGG